MADANIFSERETTRSAAEFIRRQRQVLAEELAVERLMPASQREPGAVVEDALVRLACLAEALAYDAPELFRDYVAWNKVAAVARGVPVAVLTEKLKRLETFVAEKLPAGEGDRAREVVAGTLRDFASFPTDPPSHLDDAAPLGELARNFLTTLLERGRAAAGSLLFSAAKSGVAPPLIYGRVLRPCLEEIGRLWQTARINAAQEHFCAQSIETAMAMIASLFHPMRKRLVFTGFCVANEHHELGIRMLGDYFEIEGWDVVHLGANVPTDDVASILVSWKPDVMGLSATMVYNLPEVEAVVKAVREAGELKQPKILVGGRPFRLSPELWKKLGADGSAYEPEEVLALVNGGLVEAG
jgi:MerR family transcriptional regulator, light-induced transcriptional regulator